MREPRRIFISHNAKDDPEARAFLKDVIDAISAEKDEVSEPLFEVLVDRDLSAGEPWRKPLYTWMLLCDTAVMLLDEKSKDSRWMPREAMIFIWRRQLDPGFTLLPVLRDVTKDIFQLTPFTEMGVEELGNIACKGPAEIVRALKAQRSDSTDRRLGKLLHYLGPIEPGHYPDGFMEAQQALGLGEQAGFLKAFSPDRAVAAALLGFGFRQGPLWKNGETYPSIAALDLLSDWLSRKSTLRPVCEALASYWVARDAGAALHHALNQTAPRVVAVPVHLGDQRGWTSRFIECHFAEAFAQDVKMRPKIFRIHEVSHDNGMEPEVKIIERSIRADLWARIAPGTQWSWSEQDNRRLAQACTRDPRRPEFFFWATDLDPFQVESLVTVQKAMPYVRLIYLCDGDKRLEGNDICWIETGLSADDEDAILADLDRVNATLNGVLG